jgi:aminopeptidase N
MRTVFTIVTLFSFLHALADYNRPYSVLTANSANYDVIYHRIKLTVNPASSAAITNGSVTTYFRTTAANVSSIEFDLDGAMTVSSATYHGATITKSHNTSTDVLSLTIPNIAVKGTLDSVTINYSGTPILAPASGVPSGYNYKTHGSPAQYAIFTLDEPYTAHNWWPCKETLSDKVDSCVELVVTAPSTYKVAGNGVLVSEIVSGGNMTTTWKTFYPIATYGINFAVANFQNYQFNITAGGKTFPVMNYFFSEDFTTTYKTYADELKKIIPMYVSVLGVDYPFWNEKYGLAECTSGWGALEVPSMTFVASDAYDKYTLAHEAAHQWFGDMVTTSDWHHIWLNEGFAKYFEDVVFPENLYPSELAAKRSSLKSSVSTSAYTTYVSNISTPNNIFIGSTTEPYEKGAMFLSMLRAWVGDANFFAALKKYISAPGIMHGFTAPDSLKKYMQEKTPVDLTEFFNDWIYNSGRVTYAVKYQYVTNGIYIQLNQSRTVAAQPYFDTPVPIQIKSATGLDTTVVIIDKGGILYNSVTGLGFGTNTIYFPLSKTPNQVVFDPNNVVLATGSFTSSSTLNTLISLPVKNAKLDAAVHEKTIKIQWSVLTDETLQSISIEKSSNGIDFRSIQTHTPAASSDNNYKGTYSDPEIERQQYYRLKIVQQDGSVIFSKTVSVKNDVASKLTIRPNPVRDEINLWLPLDFIDAGTNLSIYNSSGQVMKQMYVVAGSARLTVPVEDFSRGVYNLVLINKRKEKLQVNFVKE